jgi:hypothetical protein
MQNTKITEQSIINEIIELANYQCSKANFGDECPLDEATGIAAKMYLMNFERKTDASGIFSDRIIDEIACLSIISNSLPNDQTLDNFHKIQYLIKNSTYVLFRRIINHYYRVGVDQYKQTNKLTENKPNE